MHELLVGEKPAVPAECCGTKPLLYYYTHWKYVECSKCGRQRKSCAWEVAIELWNREVQKKD